MGADHSYSQAFLDEAREALEKLEADLIRLDRERTDLPLIRDVFRVMHTLKGSGAMFGFQHLSDYAHRLENIFDLARDQVIVLDDRMMKAAFEAVDHCRNLLADQSLSEPGLADRHRTLLSGVESLLFSLPAKSAAASPAPAPAAKNRVLHIHLIPSPGALQNGGQPLFLVFDCVSIGTAHAVADLSRLPAPGAMDPTVHYMAWDIILETAEPVQSIQDLFIFLDEGSIADITDLGFVSGMDSPEMTAFFKERAGGLNGCPVETLRARLESLPVPSVEPVGSAPAARPAAKSVADLRKPSESSASDKQQTLNSIRVDTGKIDGLVALVSELVTVQARLSMIAGRIGQTDLISVNEEIENISRRLRENTFSISMIPLSSLETRFNRLIHDISSAQGKKAAFLTQGLETELDKSIIEKIVPPLMHIFRNALDHGIETPEARLAAGKPESGTVTLRAFYSGAHVVIEVEDDGSGVDPERVRAKAIKKGLISADTPLTEAEILELLFLPGFSTKEQVTEVSGRGVGMDVVRTAITELRGEVSLHSRPGEGTRVHLRIPLTLSILDGLLVNLSGQKYLVPLQSIEKCYEVPYAHTRSTADDVLVLDNQQCPVIDLRTLFFDEGSRPAIASVVVVQHAGGRCGLVVDSVIGNHQAVLKSLGTMFRKVRAISGGTILGNGEIALILDVNRIVQEFVLNTQQEAVL